MFRLLCCAASLAPALGWAEGPDRLIRETEPLTPDAQLASMRVPEGFSIQLFAAEPMIQKPVNLASDSRGRLWVSSTAEYPFAAAKERWSDASGSRVKESRDAIKILEDTDGDGTADKVTDFADGLNIPTGVLPWHRPEDKAGCIAFSIPNIWYFADTDGDDRADIRQVLFGPLGYEKDTHGMCSSFRLGPDGWVYATHGFNNTSHFREAGLTLHSGNVFRFRPDGSRVERFTSGQVNPFGLAFDRRGQLYSADCHSNPITQLIRGACYQSFGKPHDGLGFAPVMCEHSHGSTGLCGIVYLDGGVWGPEWDDHILVGNCVTSRVNHDWVTFSGTTPRANEQPDFLTSDDPWFRPVDLHLGPDQALYVADFYNRIIGHYEVPLDHPGRDRERGRIWRVVKKDAPSTQRSSVERSRVHITDLESADAWTVRAAAAWYAEHPSPLVARPLFKALRQADRADASLVHQLRISLRQVLQLPASFSSLGDEELRLILDIVRAVPSAEAAAVLMRLDPTDLGAIARHADNETLEKVIDRGRISDDPTRALMEIHTALMERGMRMPTRLVSWAAEEALRLLDSAHGEADWSHDGGEPPWCVEERRDTSGRTVRVLSSLNRRLSSAERLTGTLRSKVFIAPAKLRFLLCGHQGPPDKAANGKNFVRLVYETGKTIRIERAPRTDTAQSVEWDLSEVQGSRVRLEVVDGDKGAAYAWLAVGGFEPPVLRVESFEASHSRETALRALAVLLRTAAPVGLRDRLAAYLPASAKPPSAQPRAEVAALLEERVRSFDAASAIAARGRELFAQHCAACHQLGGEGGQLGPQLDGIGQRGAARIAEDILDPWRNIDAHFQLHQITLHDGTQATGFIRAEAGETLMVVDAAGNEQRISKAEIKQDTVLPVSLMPPTFGQTMSEADFHHLLGWLLKQ